MANLNILIFFFYILSELRFLEIFFFGLISPERHSIRKGKHEEEKNKNIFLLFKLPNINFFNACPKIVNSSWECVLICQGKKYRNGMIMLTESAVKQ